MDVGQRACTGSVERGEGLEQNFEGPTALSKPIESVSG